MLDREQVQRYVRGHRKADQLVRTERRRRLRHMTHQESLAEYNALCDLWYSQERDLPPVDITHIEALLRVRRAMALLRSRLDQRTA